MKKKFNYYWRLFATALSFIFFGVGGVILWIVIFPILNLIPADKQNKTKRSQRCVHYSFYLFIGIMHKLGVMTYEVKGLEKINRTGQLIIANHPTLIDIVFLISRMPQASCIVKEQLFHNPFTKGSVINAGYIKNENPEQMIRQSVDCLKSGGTMVIFPEGTRSINGKSYKFQRSAARIAIEANATVTPVTITCQPSTLSKAEKWYQIPETRFHLVMHVRNDMVLDEFFTIKQKTIAARRFNRYLQDYFTQERENYEQYGE
jgi:1-acyl-sn-glycerol-3-phosphate acyltransferase